MPSPPRVMIVNPPVLKVLEPWFDAPKFVRTAIASLAGYLRQFDEFDIVCLDAKFERMTFDKAVDRIVKDKPDVLCLTAFTNEVKPAAYLAGRVKQRLPSVITVLGGAHLTAIPEHTMREFPTIDIGVMGEGEETLLELLRTLRDGGSLKDVKGLVWRNASGIPEKNPERPRMLNQDSLPMPAWDMLPVAEEYYIQTVRGCPFACVFCLNHNGRVARTRGVQKVIDEMNWLISMGAKRISFGDELFSVDMARTSALMDAMIEEGIGQKVRWDIQTHVAYVNDELFRKMKAANIERCEMGVEAGDEVVLKMMGKGTDRNMIMKAFRSARKHGVRTGSFFIIGQPNETTKSIWQSIMFAVKLNPNEPIFGTMVPYPGTEVARLAANEEGGYRLLTTDWDEYRKQLNGSMELTTMSRSTMEWYQITGYVLVFILNLRFLDLLRFFWNYRQGAIRLFKKALLRESSTSAIADRPGDYVEVIASGGRLQMSEMSDARDYWRGIQSGEMRRAKKESPALIKRQIPVGD
jgi:anaerobic magnesium-protoporphyrin IX monomethyl ester cyclase